MKRWVYIKNKYKDLLIPSAEGIEKEEEQQNWPLFSTIKDYSIQHGLLQMSTDPFLIRKKSLKKKRSTKTSNNIKRYAMKNKSDSYLCHIKITIFSVSKKFVKLELTQFNQTVVVFVQILLMH